MAMAGEEVGVRLFTGQLTALVTAMVDSRAREQPCTRCSEDQAKTALEGGTSRHSSRAQGMRAD